MRKLNQAGSLVLPFIIVFVLLLGSLGFAAWAFTSRQDYKNNSDKKAAAAAEEAVKAEDVKKDAEFAEKEKSPLKTYVGPATFGSLTIQYPKTWSAYISEGNAAQPIDGYFNPDFVPNITSQSTNFALRIKIVNSDYTTVMKTFDANVAIGKAHVTAYRPAKVQNVLGSMISGTVAANKQGTMVVLPLRDKTIELWTEGADYVNDFNNTILPNLTFVP